MKWIVTGAAGFVGCHATARLLQEGHEVVAIDNLSRKGSSDNLSWLIDQGLTNFEYASVCNRRAMHRLMRQHSDADAVLHLAGQVAVTTSIQDPTLDFRSNAFGTFNMLEAVRKGAGGKPAFFLSSTNKVYGALERVRTVENNDRYEFSDRPDGITEDEPLDFHSPYGCSKGAADLYVHDYARIYGMRTVVFRQSCIYGTRQFGVEDQGWVAWFIIAALTGKPINVYGDGKQVRDILWVGDLVDLYLRAFERIDIAKGQIFNVGGGMANTMSLRELLAWLELRLNRSLEISYSVPRQGDQQVFIASLAKAGKLLGWKPQTSIEEGLQKLMDWVEEHHEQLASRPSRLSSWKVLSPVLGGN